MIGGSASLALAGLALPGCTRAVSKGGGIGGYGPLRPDPAGIFDLPEGFAYRVISRAGTPMRDGLVVPGKIDGMACFDIGGGRLALVRNHELKAGDHTISATQGDPARARSIDKAGIFDSAADGVPLPGGTTTLIYDSRTGETVSQHLSLTGTLINCAGGATPWRSWLSCEETVEPGHGWIFEVPATGPGLAAPVPLKAMGRFRHEAAAVDPASGIVYLTEDREDGLFYRFIPDQVGRLAAGGRLQALATNIGDSRNWSGATMRPGEWHRARWIDMDDVESPGDDLRARGHAKGAALFARGEGIHFGDAELYFTCTSGGAAKQGQVMRYAPDAQGGRIALFHESVDASVINHADNLTIAPWHHLILCEDKGGLRQFNHLKGMTPAGEVYTIGRNVHPDRSELAGVCFSPDATTLFVNIYAPGLTLAITGPWSSIGG